MVIINGIGGQDTYGALIKALIQVKLSSIVMNVTCTHMMMDLVVISQGGVGQKILNIAGTEKLISR